MSDEQQTSTTPTSETEDNSSFEQQVSDAIDTLDNDSSSEEPSSEDNGADVKQENDNKKDEEPKQEEQKDNTDNKVQYPDKFKNEDGSLNTENLLKSYLALEPLMNEKAQWTKEKNELLEKAKIADEYQQRQQAQAQAQGYSSINDMEAVQEIVNTVAQTYYQYIGQTEDPNYTLKLLNQYIAAPSKELMEDIEYEFSSAVNKAVAIAADRKRAEIEDKYSKQQEEAKQNLVKSNINATVNKHKDVFNIGPFKDLYVKALETYGDKFTPADADVLIDAVQKLKDYYYEQFQKENNLKDENKKQTDSIANINPISKPGKNTTYDIANMSETEFENTIYDLI